jgi:hypothetical protein
VDTVDTLNTGNTGNTGNTLEYTGIHKEYTEIHIIK